jgi:hypothetical protein
VTDAGVHASLSQHLARYFDACDRCDLDAVMGLLAGATVEAGGVTASDPAAIRAVYEARQPAPTADGRRRTKHHVTNLQVDGPDAEGAHLATAYYFRLEPDETGSRVAASGRLQQRLVDEGDRWRVVRHSIISDF